MLPLCPVRFPWGDASGGAAHTRDPFSLLDCPWTCPVSLWPPLKSLFCSSAEGRACSCYSPWDCPSRDTIYLAAEGGSASSQSKHEQAKVKALDFQTEEKQSFYRTGVLWLHVNDAETGVPAHQGGQNPIPGSWGRIQAKIWIPQHAASSALGLLCPLGKLPPAAKAAVDLCTLGSPGITQSWLFAFLHLHPASSSPVKNKRAQNDIWRGQIWF